MHIFLANDDGIGSPGIMALARAATARGHRVTMCAPASQQSASSHRITMSSPIFVSEYPVNDPAVKAYAIDGSPADCVRLGLLQLVESPVDMLISGINDGCNAGMAVHYSGTVSAAREGALHGLHAVAASLDYGATQDMLDSFAHFVIQQAEGYASVQVPPVTVLNINAPALPPEKLKAPAYAPLCTANFTDNYLRRESPRSGTYYWLDHGAETEPPIPGADQDLLAQGHITLTLLGNPMDHQQVDLPLGCQSPSKGL